MKPKLVILSAPSGTGKTTIARALEQTRADVGYSVSATTRGPRPGEREGRDYYFLDVPEFTRRVEAGDFLEWAEYGGNRYGTLRSEIERLTGAGRHALLDIEVRGATQVRDRWESVLAIFIVPPSAKELVTRLGGRKTEDPAGMRRRLNRALQELSEAGTYDHIVVNDNLERAVEVVGALIDDAGPGVPQGILDAQLKRLRAELSGELGRSDA